MNKETADLIKQLADKLGTTAEHLWGVLIKQAPISAGIDLSIALIALLTLVTTWGIFSYGIIKNKKTDYAVDWGTYGLFLGGCLILTVITVAIIGCCLEMGLAGFLNPEYWALKQIIR